MGPAPPPFSFGEFTEMAERHNRPLHAFIAGLVHDHDLARDLTQDVFFDAWRAAQRDTPPFTAAKTDADRRRWLYRIAYRRAIDTLRHHRLIH